MQQQHPDSIHTDNRTGSISELVFTLYAVERMNLSESCFTPHAACGGA